MIQLIKFSISLALHCIISKHSNQKCLACSLPFFFSFKWKVLKTYFCHYVLLLMSLWTGLSSFLLPNSKEILKNECSCAHCSQMWQYVFGVWHWGIFLNGSLFYSIITSLTSLWFAEVFQASKWTQKDHSSSLLKSWDSIVWKIKFFFYLIYWNMS